MEITETTARALIAATSARTVRDAASNLHAPLVKALASVADVDALTHETPGIAWAGVGGDLNAMLVQGGRLMVARVDGDEIRAAAYASPVGTVEAMKIQEIQDWGYFAFQVREWCVTLVDGSVFTLRAGSDGSHTEALTDFVRTHLLP